MAANDRAHRTNTGRVLMIAYFFPPLAGSGVQRTVKFAKYLPQAGWQPIVVCGDEGRLFDYGRDESLLAEIPAEVQVLRTRFVSPYGIRGRLQRLLAVRPTIAGDDPPAPGTARGALVAASRQRPAPAALRMLGRVLHPLESPPIDPAFYWALSVLPLCRRVIEEEQVDVIYTSSDPYSDHVAGWILKRLTGRPWVADFRDPWTQTWNYNHRGWRHRCDLFAEQRVLRYADRVIGVTPAETQGLRDLAAERKAADFVTIENGFDEEDFWVGNGKRAVEPRTAGARTVLSHVGVVYDGTVIPLLKALQRLGPAGDRLHVRFVGGLAPLELRWLADHPVSAKIEILGRVPHIEAVGHIRGSDAVLLVLGEGSRWEKHYPGKLFEYMRCGQPILMIGPEGEASRLVQASGTGSFVPANDIDAAARLLELLAEQPETFRARYYKPQLEIVSRYERHELTARLAALFEDTVRANK
jgi:glycosyltransferase involved in cell wall biosynthesis